MRRPARYVTVGMVLALAVSGCNGDGDGSTTTIGAITTTSTTVAPTESPASTIGTVTTSSTTTARVVTVPPQPEWTIVERTDGDDGDTVVVLLDPTSYESVTDIDIQTIIEDVVEMFPPILEVHLVDSQEAADVVLSEVIDTDDQSILEEHYLARLEEGFRIVYTGPFSDFGITILGS